MASVRSYSTAAAWSHAPAHGAEDEDGAEPAPLSPTSPTSGGLPRPAPAADRLPASKCRRRRARRQRNRRLCGLRQRPLLGGIVLAAGALHPVPREKRGAPPVPGRPGAAIRGAQRQRLRGEGRRPHGRPTRAAGGNSRGAAAGPINCFDSIIRTLAAVRRLACVESRVSRTPEGLDIHVILSRMVKTSSSFAAREWNRVRRIPVRSATGIASQRRADDDRRNPSARRMGLPCRPRGRVRSEGAFYPGAIHLRCDRKLEALCNRAGGLVMTFARP